MFWSIFLDSVAFILGILVVGWCIALLIGRRKPPPINRGSAGPED